MGQTAWREISKSLLKTRRQSLQNKTRKADFIFIRKKQLRRIALNSGSKWDSLLLLQPGIEARLFNASYLMLSFCSFFILFSSFRVSDDSSTPVLLCLTLPRSPLFRYFYIKDGSLFKSISFSRKQPFDRNGDRKDLNCDPRELWNGATSYATVGSTESPGRGLAFPTRPK